MADSDPGSDGSVLTTVELVGDYEQIASILGKRSESTAELEPVTSDMLAVLQTVQRTDGATKSRISEELPGTLIADLDSDSVIHILRVLELYDLVTLEGNTWRPGQVPSPE